jgi:hypothetical protein
MVDVSKLVISVDSDGVRTATGDLELLNKAGTKTEKTTETLDQSVKKLTKQFEIQARNAGKSANEIKLLDLKAKGATDAQLKAAQAAMKNAEAMKKQADAARFAAQSAGATGGPFRAMRGSMQQVSWQLQDVAVQAQMGTSAFTILGQQGPQIASIFGPGGAVVGALVAFGAMVGGVLYNSLTGASELTKELTESIKDLHEETDNLNGALRELAMLQAAKRQKELEKAILEATEAMAKSEVIIKSVALGAVVMDSTLEKANDTITTQKGVIASANAELNKLSKQTDGMTDSTESLLLNLHEENILLGATESQIVAYKAVMAGATQEQVNFAVSLFEETQAQEKAIEAREEAIKAQEKAIEKQQNYTISLNEQLVLLNLSGDALYLYQASLQGGTMAQIQANAELLKSIALRKEKIKADGDAAKAKVKSDADAAKAEEKAEQDAQKMAAKAAHRGLDKITLLALQQEAERIQLADHLAKGYITQQVHDEALKGQARETANALSEIDKKALADKQAIADAKAQIEDQGLQNAQKVASGLEGIAEEGTAAQKALFAVSKAIAIAEIIVATERAAALAAVYAAGAGPIAWLASREGIRVMGYASAGIVAGTAIAGGRALGGQVRGGESYLVGERGPELLTMGTSGRIATNENLKNAVGGNSGSAVTVNQTINVTTGIQSTVRAEIVTLMPQIAQAAKGAVADARLRGGNFSKAMSGA